MYIINIMEKIDKIDLKLLLALDLNPRASFNQLGKSARVSKEVAQYRINQLLKKKIITEFFTFVNPSKIGFYPHKILIKYKSITKKIQEEMINFLLKNKAVAWAGNTEGKWDLHITTMTENRKEFSEFYLGFFSKYGKYFKEKEILIPIKNPFFNDKYLSNGKLLYKKMLDSTLEEVEIDEKDKKIIKELSKNSRAMFTDIGEKVNLSYWAVSQRVKKLIKNNVILGFKPRIDFKKLGYSYYHLYVELHNENTRKQLTEYYENHSACIMTMEHLGKYSMHIELVIKKEEIEETIMDFREQFGKLVAGYELTLIVEDHFLNIIK